MSVNPPKVLGFGTMGTSALFDHLEEKGRPLPKFGDWDVNDPASAEGFTVIFNKARDEKKTGGQPDSPSNVNPGVKHAAAPVKKPPAKGWFCCMQEPSAES